MTVTAAELGDLLRTATYPVYRDEYDVQARIEALLVEAGHAPVREVPVMGGRIDFLVDDVGIEVKVKGNREALARQLCRYAANPHIAELLVVTTRVEHVGLPPRLGGKRVTVAQIGGIL